MKTCEILIRLITILVVLVGVTLGEEVGNDVNSVVEGSGSSPCPLSEEHGQKPMKEVFLDRLGKCFSGVDKERLDQADNLNELKNFFEEYCQEQVLIAQCISISTDDAAICLNETQYNDLKFMIDTYKNGLKNACFYDGHYISVVLNVLYTADKEATSNETSGNSISECINTAIGTRDGNSTDSKSLQIYREFKVFKKCVLRKLYGNNDAVFKAQYILNEILRGMECPHPEHNTRVSCETLDTSTHHTTTTIDLECPFRKPTVLKFITTGIGCVNMRRIPLMRQSSIDEFRTILKSYCNASFYSAIRCLGDLSGNSKVCQKNSSQRMFEAFRRNVEDVLGNVCEDDGYDFAVVLNGVENNFLNRIRVEKCYDEAAAQYMNGSLTITAPSDRTMLVFSAIRQMTSCVLDNIIAEREFENEIIKFCNVLLKYFKCVDPNHYDILVPCETLNPQP